MCGMEAQCNIFVTLPVAINVLEMTENLRVFYCS